MLRFKMNDGKGRGVNWWYESYVQGGMEAPATCVLDLKWERVG